MCLWLRAGGRDAVDVIHGNGVLGVMRSYLEQQLIVDTAAKQLVFPEEMMTEVERDEKRRSELELLRRWRQAPNDKRRLLLETARLLG